MIEFTERRRLAWIASYPRSGNTWVRSFLFSLYHVFRNSFETIDFDKLDAFCPWDTAAELYRNYLPGPPNSVDNKRIAELRPRVFSDIVRRTKGVALIKTHNARLNAHGTPLIEEPLTAGAIYLVRNPLDVALSFARFRHTSVDQAIADMASKGFGRMSDPHAVYWASSSWTVNVLSWVEPIDTKILVVRYEDLVEQPKRFFLDIARHLMMKPTEEQLAKALEVTTFDKLRDMDAARRAKARKSPHIEFIRSGHSGQWRDVLTKEQIDRIAADHGAVMDRFGYLP
jgi:hypothetical protein